MITSTDIEYYVKINKEDNGENIPKECSFYDLISKIKRERKGTKMLGEIICKATTAQRGSAGIVEMTLICKGFKAENKIPGYENQQEAYKEGDKDALDCLKNNLGKEYEITQSGKDIIIEKIS